jgi:hypothetical protein
MTVFDGSWFRVKNGLHIITRTAYARDTSSEVERAVLGDVDPRRRGYKIRREYALLLNRYIVSTS